MVAEGSDVSECLYVLQHAIPHALELNSMMRDAYRKYFALSTQQR